MASKKKKRAVGSSPPPVAETASETPRASSRTTPSQRRVLVLVPFVLVLATLAWWLGSRRPARLNLLLVTIDTLRADHVGVYGARDAATPTLDALAARGARFEHAQSAVPLTGPSHSTILTGLYPPVHGVRDNIVFTLDPRHKTIATLLKQQGYRTGAFVGAYPVAAAFGFRQGFDTFTENFKESPVPGAGAQRPANEVIDDTLAFVGQQGSLPFFAWAHLYDPHAPYEPPEPYKTTFKGRPYDGEIAFADAQLGRLMEWLKTSGHEQDTVVAVLSDHGESLGEHGELTHAVLVYEATLHVPLLIAGPGVPRGLSVPARVATVDLAPTLFRLLGLAPPEGMNGRDLRPAFRGERLPPEPFYAESLFGRLNCRWSSLRVWVADDWKLIDGSRTELFHLPEDPAELSNRAPAEGPRVERMRAALHAALTTMAPGGDQARTAAIAPDQEAILRSLGYVGGSGGSGPLDEPGLPDPRDRVQLYERLQIILRSQNIPLERALAEAVDIAKHDPDNPFAYNTVASLAYRVGRLGEASRAFRRALELDPERPAVRQNYGKLLRDLGRLDESEKELRLALEQTDADDLRTPASLVETLVLAGKTDEAGTIVAGLVAKDPKNVEVVQARARWLMAVGRVDEAAGVLSPAATGLDADPLVDLAIAWIQKGEPARAQAAAEQALQQTPGQPWAQGVLGHALVLQGRREDGLAALRRALAARPKRPQAWMSLAAGFSAAHDEASAEACRRAMRELQSS